MGLWGFRAEALGFGLCRDVGGGGHGDREE